MLNWCVCVCVLQKENKAIEVLASQTEGAVETVTSDSTQLTSYGALHHLATRTVQAAVPDAAAAADSSSEDEGHDTGVEKQDDDFMDYDSFVERAHSSLNTDAPDIGTAAFPADDAADVYDPGALSGTHLVLRLVCVRVC